MPHETQIGNRELYQPRPEKKSKREECATDHAVSWMGKGGWINLVG